MPAVLMELFDSAIIPASARQRMPDGFILRPLCCDDFERGFVECLAQLTKVEGLTRDVFQRRFSEMKKEEDTYYILVIEDTSIRQVVGAGTVFLEKKFIRGGAQAAHIEDIVVRSDYRGKELGLRIIEALQQIAFVRGAYKVLLDCSEDNAGFYEKCGMTRKEIQMVVYLADYQKTSTANKAKL